MRDGAGQSDSDSDLEVNRKEMPLLVNKKETPLLGLE